MKKVLAALLLLFVINFSLFAVTTGQILSSKFGVVAAANPYAAAAGAEILEKGGNAVDAAVATAFALGVVEPYASGLGGEGVMIIHMSNGQSIAIDYKSAAPLDLSKYERASTGPLSVCTPGVVDGLIKALSEWGTMTLEQVMEPAIRLAKEGFVLNETFISVLSDNYEKLLNDLGEGASVYLKDGLLYEVGDIFKNPVLAKTLELIAKEGRDAFYRGEIAEKIEKFMSENGGLITRKDLEEYHAIVKEPIIGDYRGYKIITAPQPVGGATLLEALNILERFNVSDLSWDDPLYIHLLSEALYLSTIDMRTYCGDDPNVPVEGLVSKEYAKSRFEMIPLSKAITRSSKASERQKLAGDPSKYVEGKKFFENILKELEEVSKAESPSTTHASVVDRWGNAVAFTQTLSSFFGSGNVVPGTGIILNNEMGNFSASGPNALEPGKRPRTTIAPTIVLRPNGDLLMIVGTPGASRILSTLSQLIVNVIDFGYSIDKAMSLPKFCSYDTYTDLKIEGGFPEETVQILKNYYGYELELYPELDLFFGGPNCVYKQEDGTYVGVGSFRRQGAAAAPEK
ncbi:gamma-glutamyltransferase [Pseudothermotoga lettingae]|jgi:gamma-glutamyltranspeptidase/glutathione hydrolase|uniref:gamma-glutamyltransferase n=1 Tax=Pseudothermotoga lettingae TaxID=177758 RepID=UPI0007481771|nr:gamma-glutamyltransferase [Pseudothermotoga lettingae]KUK19984.1 MAG: Gamma-glutamyltransferase [Pseudothermotoga lettingae]